MKEINLKLTGNDNDLMGLFEMAYSLNKTLEKSGNKSPFFSQIVEQITPECKKNIEAKGSTWMEYTLALNTSINEQIKVMSK